MEGMQLPRVKNPTMLETAFAVRKAVFLMDKAVDRALAEAGRLTLMQLTLLRIVEGCPLMTQREAAGIMNLTEAAVSRQVEQLLKRRLLARKKIPEQRRAMALSLTPEGEKELLASMRIGFAVMERYYDRVPEDEMTTVLRAFGRITEGMKDLCPGPQFAKMRRPPKR
jgi:MarR family transcriptional regulator for hemolysin